MPEELLPVAELQVWGRGEVSFLSLKRLAVGTTKIGGLQDFPSVQLFLQRSGYT